MASMNKMSRLLDKIERRLGTKTLQLPEHLCKDVWADQVIANETLDTFSRFFPNQMTVILDKSMRVGNGWYVIDSLVDDSIEILGIRDVNWPSLSQDALAQHEAQGYGIYSVLPTDYSYDDIAAIQMRADITSIFLNQIFVDFQPPNKVRLTSVYDTDVSKGLKSYPIDLYIKHSTNLMTIPPTMMETFENLAQADVARFLYEGLKYFDGLETVYANLDIKLSDLETEAGKRDDIVEKLDEAHVTAANKNQPLILCI